MRKMIIIAMTMLMAVSLNAQQAANRQQAMQRIEQQVRHYSVRRDSCCHGLVYLCRQNQLSLRKRKNKQLC